MAESTKKVIIEFFKMNYTLEHQLIKIWKKTKQSITSDTYEILNCNYYIDEREREVVHVLTHGHVHHHGDQTDRS